MGSLQKVGFWLSNSLRPSIARSGAYLLLAAFGAATFVPMAAAQVVTSIQPAWVDTYYRVGSPAPAVGGRKLKVSSKYVTLI